MIDENVQEQYMQITWEAGILDWILKEHQEIMHNKLWDFIDNSEELTYVVNCSRRYGKTFVLLLIAVEFCIRNPNRIVRFAMPYQKEAQMITEAQFRTIMETCPDNIKPKYFSQKSFWRFKNGSELHLHGVNSKNEEKMRGHRADLAIIDEAAQVERLHYLVHDIVMPQFLTTEGKLLVASTPSPRPGHYFKEMYEKAKRDDCLSEYTVYDNTSLNPKLVRKYCEESGGEDSPTWRREYLAKFESDISRIVIPEWDSSKFVEQYERPKKFELYNQYVGMDLGVADFTAAVFGYYDFENATLVIEEEFTSSGASQTTEYIYDSLSIIENRLQYKNIDIRIADNNNPQLLNDLAIMYDYHMSPVSKNTLISMINKLRTWVNAGRIKILPNCSMTIGSLENAWWDIKGLKDEKYKPQIGKDDTYGHFDHLMALVYLIRNVDEHNNPVPPVYNISDNTHFINHEQIEYEESYGEFSDFHDAIKFRP